MKQPRRTDGICPTCNLRPRFLKRSYCTRCSNERRRAARWRALPPKPDVIRDTNGLSPLQAKLLNFMCHGLESTQMARRTGYSTNYIKQCKSRLYDITGCINAAHIAAWAVLNGYYKPLDESKVRKVATTNTPQHGIVGVSQ